MSVIPTHRLSFRSTLCHSDDEGGIPFTVSVSERDPSATLGMTVMFGMTIKIMPSLTKKIFQNTIVQIAGKIVSTILGLLTIMIMMRYFGAEQFGWYVTAVGFLQFIGILSDFGFTITTSALLGEAKFEKRALINTIFTWRFITAIVFNGLAPLLILFFPYPPAVKMAVTIISVSFFTIALNQVFMGYYQAELKIHIQTIGELIGRATLLALVWLFSHGGVSFLSIMLAISLSAICNTAFLWIKSRGISFSLNKNISKALWRKIQPVALSVIFNAFYLYGDRVLLPLFAPVEQVAYYGAAYRILDIITQVAALMMGLMLPLIAYSWSRGQHQDFNQRSQWAFEMVMILVIPMLAGVLVLAKPIMNLLGGADFIPASGVLQVLILSIFGIGLGMIFGHINLAIGRQKQAMWVYASAAVLAVTAYLFFIPRYGMYGAAFVTVISEFYVGLLLLFLAYRYSHSLPRFFSLFKIILAGAVMGLSIYLLPTLQLGWSITVGALIYGILILVMGVIPKKTLKEIFSKQTQPIADLTENW